MDIAQNLFGFELETKQQWHKLFVKESEVNICSNTKSLEHNALQMKAKSLGVQNVIMPWSI